ncbi:MAG: D-sedoheptulose 7-phosphate isomerase [Nanoarchaeota archaeon]|nr:D-sedoheptulose 7-phosphate isomerase [Nanoarchaeota archaeon]
MNLLRRDIRNILFESIEVKKAVITNQLDKIEKATKIIMNAYKNKKKILVFGNGGSASDAQHLAGELVGRFKMERKGFPAIALTTDSSIITSIANDFGYDKVFERQIETLANEGDVVIGISTSGNSSNVLNAMKKARELKTITIGFTGKNGYQLEELTDVCILVPSDNTPRIQEAHVSIIHILCELLEKEMESEITPAPTDRQWTPGYL